jgi:hypothetical protein
MLYTTSEYDIAIKESIRRFHGRVEITWTDANIDPTIVVDADDKNRIHGLSNCIYHVTDSAFIVPHKYAHLDSTLKLDGSFNPFPGTDLEAAQHKVGWWGATQCMNDGFWLPPYPTLTITFSTRSVSELCVCGDHIYGETPEIFTVNIYEFTTSTIPVYTEHVSIAAPAWTLSKVLDSDAVPVLWRRTITTVPDAQKMELIVEKWNAGNRVVKIVEFYSAIVTNHTDDDIISMQLTEENETRDGTLPIGNIASSELDLKLVNTTDLYFPGNTDSPYHDLLKKNRRIKAWVGLEVNGITEWILLGRFWSGDWTAEELGTTAETSARNRMELLRKSTFDTSLIYQDSDLYALAGIVLADAKLKFPDLEYTIGLSLQDYTIPYAYFDKISYFECLKKIAAACLGYCYVTRNDILVIDTVW